MPDDPLDLLFLTRTVRKQRYFARLIDAAPAELTARQLAYSAVRGAGQPLPPAALDAVVADIEAELLASREGAIAAVVRRVLRPLARVWAQRLARRLDGMLGERRPRQLLIWNGHKAHDRVLHAVNARHGIPVAYMENGVLPGSTTLDARGVNAGNSVPREAAFYRARSADAPTAGAADRRVDQRAYRRAAAAGDFELPAHYALVPFQLDRDSQILDNSPWIANMRQLVRDGAAALDACGREDLHLVFREHPSAKTRYPDLHALVDDHPRLHFDRQTPLDTAIDRADWVITVNSSVGMAAIIRERPCIVLGEAFFRIDGLNSGARSVAELAAVLGGDPVPPESALALAFLDYLRDDYVLPGDWQQADDAHCAAFWHRMQGWLEAGTAA